MITADALSQLRESEEINTARTALEAGLATNQGAVVLPSDFKLHDLERLLPARRRLRGSYATTVAREFARYIAQAQDLDGKSTMVFINPETMSARAILDYLVGGEKPGHCEHQAGLNLKRTVAYDSMLKIGHGLPLSQQAVAEYLEDWKDIIECRNGDGFLDFGPSLAAIRKLTIETARKVESTETQLSASLSAFEQVAAKADAPIPTFLDVRTEPYAGLSSRVITLRLSVVTTNEKPSLILRPQNLELHQEQMATEFMDMVAALIQREAQGRDIPVVLGTFDAKA